MESVTLRIYGQVQGVFFRRSAKEAADGLGVKGWVKNRRDGTVEIEAVGDKKSLEKFVNWCKKGPPLSRVEKVEVDWFKEGRDFDEFEII